VSFLEEQKALHDAWKSDMEALIEGQNTALQQVVAQAATNPPNADIERPRREWG
jgi:hypothetical protein